MIADGVTGRIVQPVRVRMAKDSLRTSSEGGPYPTCIHVKNRAPIFIRDGRGRDVSKNCEGIVYR